ncbi:RNA polymerase subunit sigma [Myxococcus xanthus]|uniref:RNA polymerase subunit sigma n=1 Tax=Myxococcus xanthus TaxID=34 RepID=A0A7Y4MT31_MYXXA|nr:RNA polymerase subunit sigma [Myxococcus xanthus]NOJ80173.1 RNA polymerase subunit sigma [Myxococcus xanthus]NOJ88008.1 RNA polymerase subunit sigma [Myxococcus xanthus]
MADSADPKYLDKRTVERYVRSGQLDETEYERHLQGLPDVAEKSVPVETLMLDDADDFDDEEDDFEDEDDDTDDDSDEAETSAAAESTDGDADEDESADEAESDDEAATASNETSDDEGPVSA